MAIVALRSNCGRKVTRCPMIGASQLLIRATWVLFPPPLLILWILVTACRSNHFTKALVFSVYGVTLVFIRGLFMLFSSPHRDRLDQTGHMLWDHAHHVTNYQKLLLGVRFRYVYAMVSKRPPE